MSDTRKKKTGIGKAKPPSTVGVRFLQQAVSAGDMEALLQAFAGKRYGDVEHVARRMLLQNPEAVVAWKALGVALRQMGRSAEASEAMQQAVRINPMDAEAHNNLAVLLKDLGRLEAAVAAYRRATDLKPDYVEAHNNLGVSMKELQRFAEAASSFRRVIALRPDYGEAYYNLGVVLQALQQPEAAVISYRQAIALKNPRLAEAHGNLGNALYELGRLEEAEASFRQALQLKPDSAELHYNFGNVLNDLARFEAAEDSYRRAIGLKPDFSRAYNNLGVTLRDLGRHDEAEAAFRRALELEPKCPASLEGLASLLIDKGYFDDARRVLEEAHDSDPESPTVWARFTSLRKMLPNDHAWLREAQKMVGKSDNLPQQKSALYYAMGKFCDDLQDYPTAFGYYRLANRLKKLISKKYDPIQASELTSQIMRVNPATSVRTRHAGADSSLRPLFIVGMPRSGTSLLEQIIAAHPAICGAGELRFWGNAFRTNAGLMMKGDYPENLIATLAETCLANLDRYGAKALRVVDKMPGNFNYLGLIHAVFPQARILHIQRHPVDTCLSIYFQDFRGGHAYANDLADLAHYYLEYQRLIAYWRRVLPEGIFLDVPYEALVEDPDGWSRQVIDFIGLEWHVQCLDFHKIDRRVGTASNWQARQPIYKTSRERWRNYAEFVGPLMGLVDSCAAGKNEKNASG